MSVEIKVPEVGESIEQVTIDHWLKKPGETVQEDETIAVLETEKVTVELPAPKSGVLESIEKKDGETAAIGEIIAHIRTDGAVREKKGPERPEAERPREEKELKKEEPKREAKEEKEEEEEKPRERAEKKEPRPREEETAPKEEEEPETKKREEPRPATPVAAGHPSRAEQIVPMTPIRQKIAERLVEAQRNAALLTTFNKVDMFRVLDLRRRYQEAFQQKHQIKLGLMSFFVKASIEALKQVPEINAEVRDNSIVYRNYYDIGIAIGAEAGLVVPIIRNAERLSFAAIERQIADFARRAAERRIRIEELQGGTFTISNGGVYGSMLSTPIVNPPQSGVLGMHAIEEQAVVHDGAIVARPMMYVALTYDHRIVDGRQAVGFLKRIKEAVEDPAMILLEI